ncbi:hypothetical protein RI367_002359 [Sorochytrium milnesiophthora]
MRSLFTTLLVLALCTLSALAAPTSSPPPTTVIEDIKSGGSGCPQGTVAISESADKTTYTLSYDQFTASTGPGTRITDSRKACVVSVKLGVPQGFSFAVDTTDFRGFADIPRSVKAQQSARIYFGGQLNEVDAAVNLNGPFSNDYTVRYTVNTLVWSPCGGDVIFNVNSQVRIDNSADRDAAALLTTDSQDGKFSQIFGLSWRRC